MIFIKRIVVLLFACLLISSGCNKHNDNNNTSLISNASAIDTVESVKTETSSIPEYINYKLCNSSFVSFDKNGVYYTDKGTLYKVGRNDDTKKIIARDSVESFVVSDDWIYFRSYGALYRIKTDGSDQTKLLEDCMPGFAVYNKWIYYSTDKGVFKTKTDGNETSVISDDTSYMVYYIDSWLYYQHDNYMHTTKTGEKQYLDINVSGPMYFDDGYTFFIDEYDNCIYRECASDSSLLKITDEQVNDFSVSEDYIFYLVDGKITRINKDGSERFEIPCYSGGYITGLEAIDNWVYYKEVVDVDNTDVCRVDIEGNYTNAPNNGSFPKKFPLVITASSSMEGKNNPYSPEQVVDGTNETAWGVHGSGEGEWIKLTNTTMSKNGTKQESRETLRGIAIINGNAKSEKLYRSNNRPKKIKLEFSDGTSRIIDLKDDYFDYNSPENEGALEGDAFLPDYQVFDFDREVDTTYVKITILETYKGSKTNDTFISEVMMF